MKAKSKEVIKKSKEGGILLQRSRKEKILYGVVFAIFLIYGITLIFPFLYLLVNSFQDGLDYILNLTAKKPFALPKVWHFENYKTALTKGMYAISPGTGRMIYLPEMFLNSIWYCSLVIFGSVMGSSLTGYCLSKFRFRGRGLLYSIAIITMTMPIVGATGSAFKLISTLGIYNSPLYVIFSSINCFGFNFLVMYAFFSNISWSYAEAVYIDGGNDFTVFFKIMLPQAKAPLLTLAIMSFIASWNEYMQVLLYLPDFPTVASGLYRAQFLLREAQFPTYFAGLVISILPLLIVYSAFSNVIMSNFTMGGLKG